MNCVRILSILLLSSAHAMRHAAVGQEVSCVDCPQYEALNAKEKAKVLWDKVNSDPYPTDTEYPTAFLSVFQNLKEIRRAAKNGTLGYTFDRASDENPTNHNKVIHSYGSVAQVRVQPVTNDAKYTGIFQNGAEDALLRLSIVAPWDKPCKGGVDFNFKGCLKPSLALKVFRAGVPSSNVLAQANLGEGVGRDFNFFHHNQGTWLPDPKGLSGHLVANLFEYAATPASGVGVQEFGFEPETVSKESVKAPKMVYFIPHEDVKDNFSSDEHDVRKDFASLPVGTKLYKMLAPKDADSCVTKSGFGWKKSIQPVLPVELSQENCPHDVIAELIMTSKFVASAWGDQRLFFQHERLEKGGKFHRHGCMYAENLPDDSEYRTSFNHRLTCTNIQECPPTAEKMLAKPAGCPLSQLDSDLDLSE